MKLSLTKLDHCIRARNMEKKLAGENRTSAAIIADLVRYRTLHLSHRTRPNNIAVHPIWLNPHKRPFFFIGAAPALHRETRPSID